MEPEGSLPHSKESAVCHYPEPHRSSPCPHPTSLRSTLIISSHLRVGLSNGLFPSGFPIKNLYASCLFPIHALSIPVLCVIFVRRLRFYSEELLAPRPTPKLEKHPLSVVYGCLFNIFAATHFLRAKKAAPPERETLIPSVFTICRQHSMLSQAICASSAGKNATKISSISNKH